MDQSDNASRYAEMNADLARIHVTRNDDAKLLAKFSLQAAVARYLYLTDAENQALALCDSNTRHLKRGHLLASEGGDDPSPYFVNGGLMHSSVRTGSGKRQIINFHSAGEMIGLSSMACTRAVHTLTAVSDCLVTPISLRELGQLFESQPRIAGFLYAIAAANGVVMNDRVTVIGKSSARQRVGWFLLDILARLRITDGFHTNLLNLPLSQSDIADAVGLTKVHVNRTFRQLDSTGTIERLGRQIRIIDEQALISETGYTDRYARMASHWMANPQESEGQDRTELERRSGTGERSAPVVAAGLLGDVAREGVSR